MDYKLQKEHWQIYKETTWGIIYQTHVDPLRGDLSQPGWTLCSSSDQRHSAEPHVYARSLQITVWTWNKHTSEQSLCCTHLDCLFDSKCEETDALPSNLRTYLLLSWGTGKPSFLQMTTGKESPSTSQGKTTSWPRWTVTKELLSFITGGTANRWASAAEYI